MAFRTENPIRPHLEAVLGLIPAIWLGLAGVRHRYGSRWGISFQPSRHRCGAAIMAAKRVVRADRALAPGKERQCPSCY